MFVEGISGRRRPRKGWVVVLEIDMKVPEVCVEDVNDQNK